MNDCELELVGYDVLSSNMNERNRAPFKSYLAPSSLDEFKASNEKYTSFLTFITTTKSNHHDQTQERQSK